MDSLPPKLLSLYFGEDFAHPINNLPTSITTLKFHKHTIYDLPIDHLPPKLIAFRIRNAVPLHNLPSSLVLLIMMSSTISSYPPNLKKLKYCPSADQFLSFPPSLEHLTIFDSECREDIDIPPLPPNLIFLVVDGHYRLPSLPSTLLYLQYTGHITKDDVLRIGQEAPGLNFLFLLEGDIIISRDDTRTEVIDATILPPNLNHLTFGSYFGNLLDLSGVPLISLAITTIQDTTKQLIQSLPPTLKSLIIGKYDHIGFPPALEELFLSYGMINDEFELPPTMVNLTLGLTFDYPLPPLPDGLEKLNLGESFYHPLPDPLPINLKSLTLGNEYNQPLPPLPSTLEKLCIGELWYDTMAWGSSKYSFSLPTLPNSITELQLGFPLKKGTLSSLPPTLQQLKLKVTDNPLDYDLKLPPLPLSLDTIEINDVKPSSTNPDFFVEWASLFE